MKTVRSYRKTCGVWFLKAKPAGWKPCKVAIEVEYRCPRGADGYVAFDVQNAIAALKPGLDAMADVGIVPSDSHEFVQWGAVRLITQAAAMKGKTPGVTLTIRRIA